MTFRSHPPEAAVVQAAHDLNAIVSHCGTGHDDTKGDERVSSARRLAEALRTPHLAPDESMRIDTAIERVVTYISLIESASETGASDERLGRMRQEARDVVTTLISMLSVGRSSGDLLPGNSQKRGTSGKPAGSDYGQARARRSGGHLPGPMEHDVSDVHAGSVCVDVAAGVEPRDGATRGRDPFWIRPPEWQILLENGRINQSQPHRPVPPHDAAGPGPHVRRRMTAAFSTLIAAALATIAFAE